MKIWKSYRVWGVVFLFFVLVWIGRTSLLDYRISVERAKAKYEIEMKIERGALKKGYEKEKWYIPPPPPKKPTVDWWGWVVKFLVALTGLKTILEIIDRFRRKKP